MTKMEPPYAVAKAGFMKYCHFFRAFPIRNAFHFEPGNFKMERAVWLAAVRGSRWVASGGRSDKGLALAADA